MPLYEAATLNRFANQGEKEFAKEFPCIVDRLSLSIVASTHTYLLPDYVADIRRVTWKGLRVYPVTHRQFREGFGSMTSSAARPTDYIFDNIGRNQIRFFPIPNVTIASTNSNLWGSEIINRVIIEYYRVPDHVSQIIPFFFRRRLLKAYVLMNAFAIEGRGQNLKGAKYWSAKYKYLKETYGLLTEELLTRPRRLIIGTGYNINRFVLPRPQLPYDKIGLGVETGE